MYYNDVKSAYENLQYSVSGIVDTLSGLVVDINSGNVYMSAKLMALSGRINSGDVTGVNAILSEIDSFVDREHENLSGFYNSLQ
jgi:phage-related protein